MTKREKERELWNKIRGTREKLLEIDGLNRFDAGSMAFEVQEEVDKLETLEDCIALFKNAEDIAENIVNNMNL